MLLAEVSDDDLDIAELWSGPRDAEADSGGTDVDGAVLRKLPQKALSSKFELRNDVGLQTGTSAEEARVY